MKDATRARVAAVFAAAALKRAITAVYDYSISGYRSISAELGSNGVEGYDHSAHSHFSGTARDSLGFYDHRNSKHVDLRLEGSTFEGYDYDTQKHFSGTIDEGSISIYDHETRKYYNYSA